MANYKTFDPIGCHRTELVIQAEFEFLRVCNLEFYYLREAAHLAAPHKPLSFLKETTQDQKSINIFVSTGLSVAVSHQPKFQCFQFVANLAAVID